MGGIDRSSLHLCNFLGSASRAGLCSGQLGFSYWRATGSNPSLSPSCSHPQRPLYEGKASNYSARDRDRLPILWNRTAESRFPLLLPPLWDCQVLTHKAPPTVSSTVGSSIGP